MLSRRELLARLGYLSGALLLGCGQDQGRHSPTFTSSPPEGSQWEVVVVGGGVAGLYTAYRLLQAGAKGVLVLEQSQRWGGRLYSLPTPEAPELACELGGMRILNSHRLVLSLARQLHLPLASFASTAAENLLYVRGRRLTVRDVLQSSPQVPYQLAPQERGQLPIELAMNAILRTFPGVQQLTPSGWEQFKRGQSWQGRPLHQWGWGDFLRSQLSAEGFAFLQEALGYTSLTQNYNAAEIIHNLVNDFPPNPEYLRIVGGYQRLPLTLAQQVASLGGQLHLGLGLTKVSQTHLGFQLQLSDSRTLQAKIVILALPPRALSKLSSDSEPLLQAAFRQNLGAVSPVGASRLFLAYDQVWWQNLGIKGGASTTDLPLRMCFYLGSAPPRSLLLASYADARAVDFWTRYLDDPQRGGTRDPFATQGLAPELQAPRAMVSEAQAQLGQLHGLAAPLPYWAAHIDWSRDPFGGWHFWNPGFLSQEVQPQIRRPLGKPPLFVCGEAFSLTQAWVQGALESSEEVLQKELGLGPAPWLVAPGVSGR